MLDQMGLLAPVTSRVPQRYLIRNETGLTLWYWAAQPGQDPRRAPRNQLDSYRSEEMKVWGADAVIDG
jgi:hypothetical protein